MGSALARSRSAWDVERDTLGSAVRYGTPRRRHWWRQRRRRRPTPAPQYRPPLPHVLQILLHATCRGSAAPLNDRQRFWKDRGRAAPKGLSARTQLPALREDRTSETPHWRDDSCSFAAVRAQHVPILQARRRFRSIIGLVFTKPHVYVRVFLVGWHLGHPRNWAVIGAITS